MKRIELIPGMFGTEFRPKRAIGLICGQMRPTTHDCEECGLNRNHGRRISGPAKHSDFMGGTGIKYPTARCECPRKENNLLCEKIVHNGGWYNMKGEKIGWGDLCQCDLLRIGKMVSGPFIVLQERESFWDVPKELDRNNPGMDYVRSKMTWATCESDIPIYVARYNEPEEPTEKKWGEMRFLEVSMRDVIRYGF